MQQQEVTTSDYRKLRQDMIYVNTISLTELSLLVCGILSSYRYVVSAESVNCFENRLDIFWKDQIIYNFRAEIYGTGNRSEVTV